MPHLLEQIRQRAAGGERVLVTTLTKRLAEDLAAYFSKQDVRCKWLHSDLDAFERVELLRDLRLGQFDVLVGVNLLREGLDLPEVSLVAILDADKEGFLRSETSLMQTIGRSARNVNAKVLLYADKVTDSMQRAIEETRRRRVMQEEYNAAPRHHAGDDPQGHSGGDRGRGRRPRPVLRRGGRGPRRPNTSPRNTWPSWRPRCWRPPKSWSSSGRPRCGTASSRCASSWASRWPRRRSITPRGAGAAATTNSRQENGEGKGLLRATLPLESVVHGSGRSPTPSDRLDTYFGFSKSGKPVFLSAGAPVFSGAGCPGFFSGVTTGGFGFGGGVGLLQPTAQKSPRPKIITKATNFFIVSPFLNRPRGRVYAGGDFLPACRTIRYRPLGNYST